MKNDPSNETPGSPPPEADDVTITETVDPDGHWQEMTRDSRGLLLRLREAWPAEGDEVMVTEYEYEYEVKGTGGRLKKLTN